MTLKLYELETQPGMPDVHTAKAHRNLKDALQDGKPLALIDGTGAVYRIADLEPGHEDPAHRSRSGGLQFMICTEDKNPFFHSRIGDALEAAGDHYTLGLVDGDGRFCRPGALIPIGQLTKDELQHHLDWTCRAWGGAKGVAGCGKGPNTVVLVHPADGGPAQIHLEPHPAEPANVEIVIDGVLVLFAALPNAAGIVEPIHPVRLQALKDAMRNGRRMIIHAENGQTLQFNLEGAAQALRELERSLP